MAAAVGAGLFLAVTAAAQPVFTQQPSTLQISNNSTVVFSAAATGATGFQWRKDGAAIPTATTSTLVIFGATRTEAGAYTVVASDGSGRSTTSLPASLTIAVGNDFGRLSNLSILTDLSATTTDFTLGTVIGGANTTATPKPLLIRAVGPSLAQPPLNVADALPDPSVELFGGQTRINANDDWGGATTLKDVSARVGAFPLTGDNSRDAAIFTNLTPTSAGYTVRVFGPAGASGQVLAELYDATSITAFPAATPRLINVSVRKQIDAGAVLTAGFVIGGSTAKTVLVRAIGPGLGVFGVPGVMADPRLELFNSNTVTIASNDNWGGDPQKAQACARVGAFAIENSASADAMLLVTLVPGTYTAQVRGVTGGGMALVEVYDVP